MQICVSYTRMLLVCLMVLGWNSESSKLVPHFWVLADSRMSFDLPRGMGQLIGEDLDANDEGSE
jgi:hypothetical protein